jgi:hypothetical protein
MTQPTLKVCLQLIAAYALNAAYAWVIMVAAERKDALDIGYVASRWSMLWEPFLGALCVGWPAFLGLTAAAFMRAHLTSALYFAGALLWMFLLYDDALHFRDAAEAFLVVFGLNLAWFPVLAVLGALEAWLKKQLGERPASAATVTSGIAPPTP